jgi:uncharacterized damage-inducible protein DinB
MNRADIQLLFQYNDWANIRVLDQAARISPDQYSTPADVPHGSLRGTLVHALAAEVRWRQRWQGDSTTPMPDENDLPTFDALRKRWAVETRSLNEFLFSLTEDDLNRKFHYKRTRGEPLENVLWHTLAHVVNHGTQHRTEAAILLTLAGCPPGNLDLVVFLREAGYG